MFVRIHNQHRRLSQAELTYAVRWATEKLMGRRLAPYISVDLIFHRLDDKTQGYCNTVDDGPRFRAFELEVTPNLSKENTLRTIFHELVHAKQYAREELKHVNVRMNKWMGNDFPAGNYWDYPWEIEAYGREYTMYRQYIEHLVDEGIEFH